MTFEQWIQSRLTAHGYATGGTDGVIGTATIAAPGSMSTPTRWKRNFWTNAKPNRVKAELDFRNATWVRRVGEPKTKFEGVSCTPLEKSH